MDSDLAQALMRCDSEVIQELRCLFFATIFFIYDHLKLVREQRFAHFCVKCIHYILTSSEMKVEIASFLDLYDIFELHIAYLGTADGAHDEELRDDRRDQFLRIGSRY